MNFIKTDFEGVFLVENKLFMDVRGIFQKLFQKSLFTKQGLDLPIDEHFFSISHKGVIRGMHFQKPPHAQAKLVYVLQGRAVDVVVDLRPGSATYKHKIFFELSSDNRQAVFIPPGFAHGFQSQEDNSLMIYLQSSEYAPDADAGISPLSIGMEWPVKEYILSEKDKNLPSLKDYSSSF
jgi:dTDP-4-dehydrorhamnose 3,5-epimerase